jgi:hypothetical protein
MPAAFDPLRFLAVAEELARPAADEPELRTAVSRAYYALYLSARDQLGEKAGKGERAKTMTALNRRDPGLKQKLALLERLRVAADYHLVPRPPYDGTWKENWLEASQLVEDIQPRLARL